MLSCFVSERGPTVLATTSYAKLSALLGRHPECTIFRRFGPLGSMRLLHLQAEISHLEFELATALEYYDSKEPTLGFATSWTAMNGVDSHRARLSLLFEKLDRYYSILLQTREVLKLPGPPASALSFLRRWLEYSKGGKFFLSGVEREPYHNIHHTPDLVTLFAADGEDCIAQFLSNKIVPWYHSRIGHKRVPTTEEKEEGGLGPLWEYQIRILVLLADVICIVLSCLIPISSIYILYYTCGIPKRLMVATIMSFVFSSVMAIIVRGRRADVFAATTAFAAVQVVFVGGVTVVANQ